MRSSYGSGDELLNITWPNKKGDLLDVGEREHYLQGVKLRKHYIDDLKFLEETFHPEHHYVLSTNLNRTIMSAYSQLLGLYPLGTGASFPSSAWRKAAVPPFKLENGAGAFSSKTEVLPEKYSPFPIHVLPGRNHLLSGNNYVVCPVLENYITESFEDAYHLTKSELFPLYSEMLQKWAIEPEKLDIEGAWPYIDTYDMAIREGLQFENDLSYSSKRLLDKYWHTYFYEGLYGNPKSAQLTASDFLSFLIQHLKGKVRANQDNQNSEEFYQNIRHIFLSGHDTSIAAVMKALDQEKTQKSGPPPASMTLIELIKRGATYYIRWSIDDLPLEIGNRCDVNHY